jgi:hypothetical protein
MLLALKDAHLLGSYQTLNLALSGFVKIIHMMTIDEKLKLSMKIDTVGFSKVINIVANCSIRMSMHTE